MTWDISGKTVLITGGNAGIGKATAIELARRGANVTITSRNPSKGTAALEDIRTQSGNADVECRELDLASFASIRTFAEGFLADHERLDVLINNAGLVLSERHTTKEGFEMTFGVNHLGHFLLTDLLLERIKDSAPARIVNLASDAHKGARDGLAFDDLQFETRSYAGFKSYCESKLANILYTRELARRLEGTDVTVNAVHPGLVKSRFGRDGDTSGFWQVMMKIVSPFGITVEKGAETSVTVATDPALANVSGEYFAKSKPASSTRAARDDQAAKRLWDISESLIAKASS